MSAMSNVRHYVNLSNGRAHRSCVPAADTERFLRIESTACEQKHWAKVAAAASADLLAWLAKGGMAVVHDSSERARVPRSIWQGAAFIEYCCIRAWWNERPGRFCIEPRGSGKWQNVAGYFEECWRELPRPVRRGYAYFSPKSGLLMLPQVRACIGDGRQRVVVPEVCVD